MSPTADDRRQRGQATVEVALALPVVIVVLLLVVQVALVARSQILVVHAAREGARAAAVEHSVAAARRAAAATPGLGRDRMQVTMVDRGDDVSVTVGYRAPTDVALVGPLVGERTLTATVVMRREDPGPGPGP